MTLVVYEWRKLFRLPALWAFILLCLAFNGLLLLQEYDSRGWFNDTSAVTAFLGQRVDDTFAQRLASMPRTEHRVSLLGSVEEMENIYEDYDLETLSAFYANQVRSSPMAVRWMTWKYRQLMPRVEHLAQTGAAMDLYAGPVTQKNHQFLFGTLLRAITAEGAILGMLSMLYLLGYEHQNRTALTVYSSRTGRGVCRWKILAGVLAGVLLYLLVLAVTLGGYLSVWDYGGVWSASVSSQFNYLVDLLHIRPFFTWADFTVGEYLTACVALGGGLTMVFTLLAGVFGTLIRNTYLAALSMILLFVGVLTAICVFGDLKLWPAYFALSFSPLNAWLCAGGWFTELGLSAVVPWQETISVVMHLALLGIGTACAFRHFSRKDVF